VTAVGIDVGWRRKGFHACAVRGREVVAGPERLADVAAAGAWAVAHEPTAVALDSPRSCAPPGESSRADERALNREACVIRWTPERSRLAGNPYYGWVEHGLELYAGLAAAGVDHERLVEVFPTAAWTIWAGHAPVARRGRRRHVAELHTEGRSRAFGEIIVPAGGSPGARRRARTNPAPPAAAPGRPAPGRRG
jgi:Protein of unknown function (DUF429)